MSVLRRHLRRDPPLDGAAIADKMLFMVAAMAAENTT